MILRYGKLTHIFQVDSTGTLLGWIAGEGAAAPSLGPTRFVLTPGIAFHAQVGHFYAGSLLPWYAGEGAAAGISPGSNVRFITDMDSGLPVFVTTDLDGTATTVKSVQTGGTKVLSKHAPGGTTKIRVVQ